MSRLSDLVAQAVTETERDGSCRVSEAATLVVERADEEELRALAFDAARRMCKKTAQSQGPAASRASSMLGQSDLFPELHRGYAIDAEGQAIRLTGNLSRVEFKRVMAIREKQIDDDAAHLRALREAYTTVSPFWDSNPDWTFDQCCHAYAEQRGAA